MPDTEIPSGAKAPLFTGSCGGAEAPPLQSETLPAPFKARLFRILHRVHRGILLQCGCRSGWALLVWTGCRETQRRRDVSSRAI